MRQASRLLLCVALLAIPAPIYADASGEDDRPDPAAVQRYGPAYRFPQAGWTVLHIEGEPYERGYQHGRLMAQEIAAHLRCFAMVQGHQAPAEAWQSTRKLTSALFLRRIAPEFLEEMKGIAEGATAAGGRIQQRPIDLIDIVALNCWPEIEFIEAALAAMPTGLEGKRFSREQPEAQPKPRQEHCSAFAATGPATADGKIVFGHITMFSLYPANFYNVWLDIKPAKGHRVLMCAYPGAMQSGMDYYLNDAGLLIAETTIAQTRFNPEGQSETSRIRQAIQYADSIDAAVAILQKDNNGLYTNEWLLGDINTNEIALFELGTRASKLHRSSKQEWIGGTTGFYWGCNNAKDLQIRLETIPSMSGRPANMVFRPSDRDQAWQRLFHKHQGKIGVAFAKEAFTSPPIAAYHSLDAKFTTTDLARQLKSWALFGPPLGRTWEPSLEERKNYPEIKPLVSNPWTILHGNAPRGDTVLAADIGNTESKSKEIVKSAGNKKASAWVPVPAWHGTILPQTDADIWLASAFADYEGIVSREKELRAKGKELSPADRDQLAVDLFAYRSRYRAAVSEAPAGETSLSAIKFDVARDNWYRQASGKGVLVLHELHRLLGDPYFEDMMDAFGREHAGKKVNTAQFEAHVKHLAGQQAADFVHSWVKQARLPVVRLNPFTVATALAASAGPSGDKEPSIRGEIVRGSLEPPLAKVDVTMETDQGEVTKSIELKGLRTEFTIAGLSGALKNVILDKYGQTALAGMSVYSIQSFSREQERTLIVY
ncbi:MAG TPA: C45 family autoproteolytic acyltransferase/hydrolase, partial [Gemmataceae bacterium]|nr:C45 family autoproteolytic acyltransferase/hydrolase [Gemmataceae bacterium]